MDLHPTTSTILSWLVFAPIIGVALIFLAVSARRLLGMAQEAVDNFARVTALAFSAVPCALGIYLWTQFNGSTTELQFVHHFVWIKSFNIEYFVGVDGVSISMVILSTLISMVAAIASMPWWLPKDEHDAGHGGEAPKKPHFSEYKVPGYMTMLLILETGMAGVFVSMDFFLFYVFWEVMLLPMYFLIGIWGGPRKEYAAIKFFLYTLAGSVLMLLAVIGIYYNSAPLPGTQFTLADGTASLGGHTFNLTYLIQLGQAGHWLKAAPIGGFAFATLVWIGFFIAFAIKVPMFPFHTWLPDAHVEAPTPISVILAGILLKMGTYGMIRINWQMFPETAKWIGAGIDKAGHQTGVPYVAIFGTINIVYAAFVCMAQKDLKKLIAYSSVSHMGYCLLGMAAFTPQGMSGAMLNMWTHGLISPMLFLVAGVIYDRAHHREIEGFGGLAKVVPEYTGIMGLAFFASLGLPGLCGFISEFLCLSGAFQTFVALTSISATAVIITAAYYLWTLQRMFLGNLNPKYTHLPDLNWRERLCLYPLGALVVVFGFYPGLILNLVNPTLFAVVDAIKGA